MCGYSGRFYFCGSANPGSRHDSPVMMQSEVPRKMEEMRERRLLFSHQMIAGDNAYQAHLWWLCTPFLMEETSTNARMCKFNKWFCGLRQTVERMIGHLKNRFPILRIKLDYHDILDSIKVVNICVAFHNYILSKATPGELAHENEIFRRRRGDTVDENDDEEPQHYESNEGGTNLKLLHDFADYFTPDPE